MRGLIGLAATPVVLMLDQASKIAALRTLHLEGASRPFAGPLDLTLVFNRSNAFGIVPNLGAVSRWGLVAFNIAIAAALITWAVRRRSKPIISWAAAFITAGALGNAVDRLRLGVVVDFLDLSRLGFHWVFNVADASVDLGIALLFIAAVRERSGFSEASATTLS